MEKIDSLFGRYKQRQRVKAYRVGTLLLRSFAHPMELAVAPFFPSPVVHLESAPIRTASARARPFFLRFSLFALPLRDGSFSATITPEIFLRLMQELCFRRFARCFAYLRGGQARTYAGARERADDGVHLQVRLATGEEKRVRNRRVDSFSRPCAFARARARAL